MEPGQKTDFDDFVGELRALRLKTHEVFARMSSPQEKHQLWVELCYWNGLRVNIEQTISRERSAVDA